MLTLWASHAFGAPAKPAELKISGYGYLGDWQLKRLVRNVDGARLKEPYLSGNLLEDTALILLAQMRKDGFLHPTIRLELTLADGRRSVVTWKETIDPPLPTALQARKAHFRIREGVRYHYGKLQFNGLQTVKRDQALSYFVETGVIPLRGARIYSPENLKRGLGNLTEVLQRQGYHDATATVSQLDIDDRRGRVNVIVQVQQGPRYLVRSVQVDTFVGGGTNQPSARYSIETNTPYTRLWVEDFSTMLKATNYHRGYPDTTVTLHPLSSNLYPGLVYLHLRATVQTGPQVFVGWIDFAGARRTRKSTLESRVPLEPGDLLDPLRAERGRNRLARLGIFDSVRLDYEPMDEQTRNLIYELKEAKALTVNLLFGYGSYEMLRGGVELQENNIFGRAHSARLRAIQSFKATQGDFTYTIPEVLGEDVDIFSNGFALRREEVSFTREEYGGGLGVHRYLGTISSDISGRYNYQVLNAVDLGGEFATVGPVNPAVGSWIMDLRHDQRDSPLYPRKGYKIFSTLELASPYLAGDVSYERFNVSGSYHQRLFSGLGLNLGLSHGFIATPGTPEQDVPFNKRFFPGGADSIRGYQEGEAAPRNAEGKIIGAESYLLGTVELEQSLTRLFSIVFFSDSMGVARSFGHYPFDQTLYSVGVGLRFRTIVGPVRLEYGHNLNPREHDPSGTLHFSFGFPF